MSKLLLIPVWLILMSCLTPCFADPIEQLDAIVASHVQTGKFIGAVLVGRDADIIFHKTYGSANLEWNIASDTQTKFRLGSLTKQFTAACILLLEHQGKLHTS